MTRVDFYLLPDRDPQARRVFACRLAEKAYRLEHKVFICTEGEAEARILDDLLWTFRQGSFVPHTLVENFPNDPMVAVVIGTDAAPAPFHTLLINLSPEVPSDWQRFLRIAEVITQDDTTRTQGRSKYRFYQDQSAELHLHQLASD